MSLPEKTVDAVAAIQRLELVASMQVLIQSVRAETGEVVSLEKFDAMCAAAGYPDAPTALTTLDEAGVVIDLDDCVHLKPARLARHVAEVVQESWDPAHVARVELQHAINEKQPFDQLVKEAVEKTATERKRVWSGALAFAGMQLAVISRLTYFDLDWDIMEPVSYFVGTGTALFFYGFLLWYKQEHSYERFDDVYLSNRVRKILSSNNFDFERYGTICKRVADARATVAALETWYSS